VSPQPPASRWTAAHVAGLRDQPGRTARLITPADVRPVAPGLDVWDLWPVQEIDGAVADIGGAEIWFGLGAPAIGDPVLRHGRARLRLILRQDGAWRDLGPALPDDWSPGSREWSGSAIVDGRHRRVTLFFTAAGRRGEASLTYEQRLFQTTAAVAGAGATLRLEGWTAPRQSLASDGRLYDRADQARGVVGEIKAFRDPAFFRDPADGRAYLLFAASLPAPSSAFNGAVGLARAGDDTLETWTPMAPIAHADGLNNELERPHIIVHGKLYYLFWSTQAEVFAPGGPVGPTGLYGMAAPALLGPYEPLNGTGLVLANPPAAPFQAYSWLVAKDLSVSSFINYVNAAGPAAPEGEAARAVFGGAPAPAETIHLDGTRAW
jgi:levansucrase